MNLYWAQIKFPMQKLAIFRKVKPPARRAYAPEGKSRNCAEAYKWYVAQVIPQIDPREIGFAFHRAGTETCPPPEDCEKGPFLDGNLLYIKL